VQLSLVPSISGCAVSVPHSYLLLRFKLIAWVIEPSLSIELSLLNISDRTTKTVMDFTYTPHRQAGGAVHLPSPTHNPHVDGLAVQTADLRRSLSRSPSKPARFPLYAQTPSGSPRSPHSPLALHAAFSPKLQNSPSNIFSLRTTYHMSEATTTPKKRFSVRRLVPAKSTARSGASTRSPMRRALSDASNQCNVTPTTSCPSSGEENRSDDSDSAGSKTHSNSKMPQFRFDTTDGPVKFGMPRSRPESMYDGETTRSTPLKRSDGESNLGTPVKRRSLHGGALGVDLDIFQQHQQSSSPLSFGITNPPAEPSRPIREYTVVDNQLFTSFSSPIQKRTGPSRKSLHRQSQILPRSRGFMDSSHLSVTQSSPTTKARNRLSLDPSFLLSHSSSNRSPFLGRGSGTTQVNMAHIPSHSSRSAQSNQPHPLSKTLTPSSSGSNLTEDSKMTTDVESHSLHMENPHLNHIFSKSLPIGSLRPIDGTQSSNSTSFATPAVIKSLKYQPAGFMSTGLISKRNRHPGFHPYNDTDRYNMPDTPSKRASFPPVTATPFGKDSPPESQTPFGDPATPLISHPNRNPFDLFGKSGHSNGLFGADIVRRSSFVSEDGDDQSPTQQDSQSSADELPPTPTKITGSGRVKQNSLRSSLFGRRTSLNPETFCPTPTNPQVEVSSPRLTRKGKRFLLSLSPKLAIKGENENGSAIVQDFNVQFIGIKKPLSFSRRCRHAHSFSPIPENNVLPQDNGFNYLNNITIFLSPSSLSCSKHTKSALNPAVTPVQDNSGQSSPITPQTSFESPDNNNFSLSVFKASTTAIAPMTPTAQRDNAFNFQPAGAPNDVDTSIRARFQSVTTIAQGEFSIVYRVEKPVQFNFLHGISPPSPGHAWVVKKMKKQYLGVRDREHKLREVEILRALKGNDHVLEYLDSWESGSRLYIQTEYCENGSLSSFLASTGNKARLDDFRVWKILLELTLGVHAIHEASFIHLDLKPANIFITFEGVLKIGDFGLASRWPAPKHIDGEGDREYIAPEALSGRFDRPADIFAVGLIALEIAGNFYLPDNGEQWQRLRSGNLTDVPSLTWSTDSHLDRDVNGDPVMLLDDSINSDDSGPLQSSPSTSTANLLQRRRHLSELPEPPSFMRDATHPGSLDRLVAWMLEPDPAARPTVQQVYHSEGLAWVARRRRAGATVFEGNWGPADEVLERQRWRKGTDVVPTIATNVDETAASGAADVEMEDV
jgi:mitosis inhibitor protein kinase SWE1